jgi:biopolymer transport protein ExbB
MTSKRVAVGYVLACGVLSVWLAFGGAVAQETAQVPPESGLTLWQLIKSGGGIMVVLGILSVIALAMIITFFVTLNPRREDMLNFTVRARSLIREGDVGACELLCQQEEEDMLSRILRAGLQVAGHERHIVVDAMQTEGARATAALSQRVGYLSNIATLAPMLGILGTVLGMIRAFNSIAFQPAVVKPLVLAGGVSMALVTTAAGLVVAIPIMAFYFYFRGRVQKVVAAVEDASADLVEPLTRMGGGKR